MDAFAHRTTARRDPCSHLLTARCPRLRVATPGSGRARPAAGRGNSGASGRGGDELAPISVPAPGIFGFTAAWRYGCRRQIELGCVRGTIAPSASTSPATPLVDDSRGVPRAAIGIEGRAQIPLRRGWLDKAEGGQRLLRRLFGFCFITNGPTTPAHFVRVVEIFARELVLPRLNDALRVADHILHFARDFDFLKGLQRSSGGCAVPEANTDEAVRIQEEESAMGTPGSKVHDEKVGRGPQGTSLNPTTAAAMPSSIARHHREVNLSLILNWHTFG